MANSLAGLKQELLQVKRDIEVAIELCQETKRPCITALIQGLLEFLEEIRPTISNLHKTKLRELLILRGGPALPVMVDFTFVDEDGYLLNFEFAMALKHVLGLLPKECRNLFKEYLHRVGLLIKVK